jgi:RHS repeat-associated protein
VKMKAYESRLALLLLSVLVASMAGRAFAALPQNAPPGMRMYVLALRGAGTAPATDREPDLVRLGGVLVETKRDLRVIFLPPERLEELRHDPRVAFVQRVGALAEDAGVQTPVARQTKSSPVPRPVTPASVALTKWEYAYDGSGNVARISGESSSAYAYDLMNRLTTATVGSAQQTYTYDAFGNRTSKAEGTQTTTFGVDPATNRLMRQTVNGTVAWTLEYDEAGHVKKDRAGQPYQFDAAGMMNHMTTTTARNRRMIYTAGDERIAVIDTFSGGKETEFTVRDFAGRVLRVWYQTDGMPLWQRDYVYADGGLIAEVRNVDAAEDPVHHFHADHLGSIRLTTAGTTGVLTRSHEFWPFGEEITSTVQESFERVQPMKFTGHERDYISAVNTESTDYLDYMHARYYTATLGRFLSVDPSPRLRLQQPQSWNRYAYALNNPGKYVDPDGRDTVVFIVSNGSNWDEKAGHAAVWVESGNRSGGVSHGGYDIGGYGWKGFLEHYTGRGREVHAYILKTTDAQDKAMLNFIDQKGDAASTDADKSVQTCGLTENCSSAVVNVLKAGGVVPSNSDPSAARGANSPFVLKNELDNGQLQPQVQRHIDFVPPPPPPKESWWSRLIGRIF